MRLPSISDERYMRLAMANAHSVRLLTPPNPWVGAVLLTEDGEIFQGATSAPGGPHAEIEALAHAGSAARNGVLYTTLEPCSHTGRTGPCTEAIIAAGIKRVVVGIEDPDVNVAGQGVARLRAHGIEVETGVLAPEIEEQLAPYLTQRRTGRPHVVVKLGMTLDGYIAAPDGTSKWITGPGARADAHRLRAESGAVVVGAGTVRADNPSLTVRDFRPIGAVSPRGLDPLRVVLGSAPAGAQIEPVLEWIGDLPELLDHLGAQGVLQLLVEGGGAVVGAFHRAALVDDYVFYLAPAIMGGADGRAAFGGKGAATIADVTRGRFVSVKQIGDDVRLVFRPQLNSKSAR